MICDQYYPSMEVFEGLCDSAPSLGEVRFETCRTSVMTLSTMGTRTNQSYDNVQHVSPAQKDLVEVD